MNSADRDGPSVSSGGVASRRLPYVLRAGLEISGAIMWSEDVAYSEGSAVRDEVDMLIAVGARQVSDASIRQEWISIAEIRLTRAVFTEMPDA